MNDILKPLCKKFRKIETSRGRHYVILLLEIIFISSINLIIA